MKPTYEQLEQQVLEQAVLLANSESKCRELAAENAGLKATCDDRRTFIMNGVQLGYIKVPTVDTDPALDTIRVAVSPQESTPATEAFLAEVQASALEYYANLFKDTVNMDVKHNQEFHKGTLYVADQFRKGAAQ